MNTVAFLLIVAQAALAVNPPSNVEITGKCPLKIRITWTRPPIEGLCGQIFKIVELTTGKTKEVTNTASTTLSLDGLATAGTQVSVQIRTRHFPKVIGCYKTSSWSVESNKLKLSIPPTEARSRGAEAAPFQISLTWAAPKSSGGTAIQGYKIFLGETETDVSNSPFVADGLINGNPYTFEVAAYNLHCLGARTEFPTATPMLEVPGKANRDGFTRRSGEFEVKWTVPYNGGTALTAFRLQFENQANSEITDLYTSGSSNMKAVTSLTLGVQYKWQVAAVNVIGQGPYSGFSSIMLFARVPDAPASVSVSIRDTALLVSWTAPSSTGGAPVSAYKITHSHGGETQSREEAPSARSVVLGSLVNGYGYTISIYAENVIGWGAAKSGGAAFVPGKEPNAPGSPSVQLLTPRNLRLTWTAPLDNGYSIDEYSIVPGLGLGAFSTTSLSKDYTNVLGGSFQFIVKAHNAMGWSTVSTSPAVITGSVPAAVSMSQLVSQTGKLAVSWAPFDGGGWTITKIEIRVLPPTGSAIWKTITQAATIASRSFEITGLTNRLEYTVDLRAVSGRGTGPFGASAKATPLALPSACQSVVLDQPAREKKLVLTWASPLYGLSADEFVTHYKISDGDSWIQTAATVYEFLEVEYEQEYTYQVVGCNLVGCTSQPTTVSRIVDVSAPDSGTAAEVEVSKNGFVLDIVCPSNLGGAESIVDLRVISVPLDSPYAEASVVTSVQSASQICPSGGSLTVKSNLIYSNTNLSVTVAFFNGVYYSAPFGAIFMVTSPPSVPSQPDAPDIVEVTDSSLTMEWSLPTDFGGAPLLQFLTKIFAVDLESCVTAELVDKRQVLNSTSPEYLALKTTIFGLLRSTTYAVRVAAYNGVGLAEDAVYSELSEPQQTNAALGAVYIAPSGGDDEACAPAISVDVAIPCTLAGVFKKFTDSGISFVAMPGTFSVEATISLKGRNQELYALVAGQTTLVCRVSPCFYFKNRLAPRLLKGFTVIASSDAAKNGSAILIFKAVSLEIDSMTIINGVSDHGGAIYAIDAKGVVMRNSVIQNSRALSHGGAIALVSAQLSLFNVSLFGNVANMGGAISIVSSVAGLYSPALTLRNCTLENNVAAGYGGALYSIQSQLTLADVAVLNNIFSLSRSSRTLAMS